MRTLYLFLLSTGLAGCAMSGGVQTASTLGQGNFELTGEADFIRSQTPLYENEDGSLAYVLPNPGAAFTYGLTNQLDVGASVTLFNTGELRAKVLLTPSSWEQTAISIAPSVTGVPSLQGAGFGVAALPLLVGYRPIPEVEVVVGPRLLVQGGSGSGAEYGWVAGAGVAYLPDNGWRIMPQLLYRPYQPGFDFGGPSVQVSLAVARRGSFGDRGR